MPGSVRLKLDHAIADHLRAHGARHYDLLRDNPVPAGTVILTGTGVIVSAEHALADGDEVEVEIPGLGRIRNRATKMLA